MNYNRQGFPLPQNQQHGGEFHQHHQQRQQQQTPEWFGTIQGNNQTQFYANDLTMTNQSSTQMQRMEIQSMNFTNFQRVPESMQSFPQSMPIQSSAQQNQDQIKKQQFEQQQRKLKEISSRGFRTKPKDGKNLVEDFISKTDLDLSSGLKQKAIPVNKFQNERAVRQKNHQNFKGNQIAHQDAQTQNFVPHQSKVVSQFDASQLASSQNNIANPQTFMSSSTLGTSIFTSSSSSPKDDFGDFQGGFGNSQPAHVISNSISLPSLSGIQTSTIGCLSQSSIFDSKSNSLPSVAQDKTINQPFDASFLNLSSQITGKQFDVGSMPHTALSTNQDTRAPADGMNVGTTGESVVNKCQYQSDVNEFGPMIHSQIKGTSTSNGQFDPTLEVPIQEETDLYSPQMLYGCKLPIWCYESQSLPAVYKKVLERSLALDGSIDTNKLYSLLLASNVSKDKLKDIWGMANKRTPGVLVQEELNIVLGLIALAQAGWSKLSISKLVSCNSPPIPEFPEYLFMDIEKENVFGGEAIAIDDWSSIRSESPVDPNDKYSVFKSYDKARSASITSIERQLSNSSKDNAEWSLATGLQTVSEADSDWANFKTAEDNDMLSSEATISQTVPTSFQPNFSNQMSISKIKSEPSEFASFTAFSGNSQVFYAASTSANSSLKSSLKQEDTAKFPSFDSPLITSNATDEDFGDFQTIIPSNRSTQSEFQTFTAASKQEDIYNTPASNFVNEIKFDSNVNEGTEKPAFSAEFGNMNVLPSITANNDSQSTIMDDSWDDFASFSAASYPQTEINNLSNSSTPGFTASFNNTAPVDAQKQLAFKDSNNLINTQGKTVEIGNQGDFTSFADFQTSAYQKIEDQTADVFKTISSSAAVVNTMEDSNPHKLNLVNQNVGEFFSPKENGAANMSPFHFTQPNNITQPSQTTQSNEDTFQIKDDNNEHQLRKLENFDGLNNAFQDSKRSSFGHDTKHIINQDSLLGSFAKPFNNNESTRSDNIKPVASQNQNIQQDVTESTFTEPVLEAENRYKALSGVIEDADRHVHEWKRFLKSVITVFNSAAAVMKANNLSLKSKKEVFECEKGKQFFNGLKEIFAVTCRVKISIENSAFAKASEDIKNLIQKVDLLWREVCAFSSVLPKHVLPDSSKKLEADNTDMSAKSLCGLCLLNVNVATIEFNGCTISTSTLTYGGRTYHSTCANFWCNKVNPVLPSLPPLMSGLL